MNDFEKLREALSGDEIFKPASEEEIGSRKTKKIKMLKDVHRAPNGHLFVDSTPYIEAGDILIWDPYENGWWNQTQDFGMIHSTLPQDWYESVDTNEAINPDLFQPATKSEINQREEERLSSFNQFWTELVNAFNKTDREETYKIIEPLADELFKNALDATDMSEILNNIDSRLSSADPGYPFTLSDIKLIAKAIGSPVEISGEV